MEQEIEQCIIAQKRWADLDNRMRDLIGSSHEYDKKILRYSIENQLRYRGNLVRFVINDEYEYYRDLLKYSRDHLMLFPYHLSDFIITGMRITPFQYYLSVMTQIIEQERSYDTLPNFTAADCLRLLGIGRNQYIDIMNELRSTYRGFLGIGLRRNARSLLPNKPSENVPIEPWWFITAGYITEDDVRSMVTSSERSIIDRLVSPDGMLNQILAADLDEAHVRSLYLKGLIYLDVPIYDDDYIVVPPLEGFVMNRVTGDYFETLLYKVFVSIDQNTPVIELAKILKIDIRLVKNAISMYCRLKFAYKKDIFIDIEACHKSWKDKLEDYKRIGINVSQRTSQPSRQVSDFIKELAHVEHSDSGVEVLENPISSDPTQQLHNHSSSMLVQSPSIILSGPQQSNPSSNSGVKKIAFFYDSNLAAFLMMGNLSPKLKNHAVTMFEVGKLPDEWIDSLLAELSQIKCDKLEDDGYETKRYYIHALMLHRTIEFIRTDLRLASSLSIENDEPDSDSLRVGLDLIRIESLSNLDTESCERFLKKNYQFIISVAPLNQDVKLSATSSLPHLGPGSPLINSLWFKLYIYHITGFGPSSLLLVQGYRLSSLPECITKHGTILIHHWNRDPTYIGINNALSAINEALTHSPILIQAYPIQPMGGNFVNGGEKVFVPFPLISETKGDKDVNLELEKKLNLHSEENLEDIPAVQKLNKSIDLSKMCGYITLLKSGDSIKELLMNNESSCPFMQTRRQSEHQDSADTDTKTSQPETKCDSQPYNKINSQSGEDGSEPDISNSFVLYDCNFGIPLFDRFLNKQVRDRISNQCLSKANTLNSLIEANHALNKEVEKFVEEFRSDKKSKELEISGDQRHFFEFPNTEQFKCPIPRPARNLLFHDGILQEY